MKKIIEDAWLLPLGNANTVLLREGDDLVLFDAGFPGKEQVVFDAIDKLGKRRSDLKHLIFTHGHPDHIGSAAAIVRETGATTWMHAADAPLAETGGPFRPMTRAPGLMQALVFRMVWNPEEQVQPFRIDRNMADGDVVPVAGGLRVIGTPGHCAGQVAFLWRGEQLLIGGDAFMNIVGLADPVGFEDEAEGRLSQRKLASLQFDAAAFGHGGAITSKAASRIRRKLGM
jgi:glyoxylase-like metal-dependent hydrolase (beta-lactamase superfamily II)